MLLWFRVFLFLFLTTPCWAGLPPTRILDEGVDKGVAFKFDCVGAGIACSQSGVTGTLTVGGGGSGDSVSIDGVAVTDPNFNSTGDVDFVDTANVVTGTVVSVRPAAENSIEALLDLQDLQGEVTDGQVPNTITVDLATTATTANAGDSATAFFASGTLEETLLPDGATVTSWVLGTSSATQITSPTVIVDLLDANGAVDMDYGSADVTDHTFITDGTTDADFVVPLTSIGAGEIVSDSLTATQLGTDSVSADELNATGVEAELEAALDIGGEVSSTGMASTVIADSVTVTGWVMGASTATTPSADDNDTSLATTAYVQTEINAMGGRSLTTSSGSMDADAELYTDTKCIWWEYPTAADDFKSIWFAKNAFTLTSIWAESDQTVTFMLQVDDGTPSDVDTVDLAPAAGTAEDTALNGDATMAAGDRLDIDLVSVANIPTWASICFTGTWDD